MGNDVEYSTTFSDIELLKIAKNEDRVLLTKDLELYQRCAIKDIEAFYVEGLNEAERLAELAERFNFLLIIDIEKSRCPKCNSQLIKVIKEDVANKVESKTYAHYNDFWQCSGCKQIYWEGAHWDKIRETFQEARKHLLKRVSDSFE